MIIQIIGAFLAVIAFSIMIDLPKKYLLWAGFVGALGWAIYLLVGRYSPSLVSAALLSSIVVSLMSHILARKLLAPVNMFFIPGILPSVPGGSIYRSVYALIQEDMQVSAYHFVETLQIAGSIALAIFLIDCLFKLKKQK